MYKYFSQIFRRLINIVIVCTIVSCENDYSYKGDISSITLSVDTLMFDTIFTGEATPTTSIRIYNHSGENMTIDKIYLAKGNQSEYNININGNTTTSLTDVRLKSGDSLYVFVNIMPQITTEKMPYIIEDEIVVNSAGNIWKSKLIAYGQNVVRIKNAQIGNSQWKAEMPYLIIGTCQVDSLSTLSILPGTHVYFAKDATIDVYGKLSITGTPDSVVVLKSSRLDNFYSDIPGQWGAITLKPNSQKSIVEYAEISNGSYALIADSAASLKIRNVIMRDMSYNAILSYGANVDIANAIIYNCGKSLVSIYGGNCSITHSTLANYYHWDFRKDPALYANGEQCYPTLGKITILNSIITGNISDELIFDSINNDNATIANSFIKLDKNNDIDNDTRFVNIIKDSDPKFIDKEKFDFRLDSTSMAIDAGQKKYSEKVPLDFYGKSRIKDAAPDIGAIEFEK